MSQGIGSSRAILMEWRTFLWKRDFPEVSWSNAISISFMWLFWGYLWWGCPIHHHFMPVKLYLYINKTICSGQNLADNTCRIPIKWQFWGCSTNLWQNWGYKAETMKYCTKKILKLYIFKNKYIGCLLVYWTFNMANCDFYEVTKQS